MQTQSLKEAGLKITMPRMRVLQLLSCSRERHLSAEGVYKSLLKMGEDVGLATVYRVLTQFETAGLVTRHYFDGGLSVFELNNAECHHDHLLCVRCGKIEEFTDESIEKRQHAIAKEKKFQMTDHCLYIYGICNDCQ